VNMNDTFQGITTIILTASSSGHEQGTGFYYQQLGPADPAKTGVQWRKIEQVWLATNRHVVLPRIMDKEVLPDSLSFHLRRVRESQLEWDPIRLDHSEVLKRARFHGNPAVDVAIIDVHDLLVETFKVAPGDHLPWSAVTSENLPGRNRIS